MFSHWVNLTLCDPKDYSMPGFPASQSLLNSHPLNRPECFQTGFEDQQDKGQ